MQGQGGEFVSGEIRLPFATTHLGLHWIIRGGSPESVQVAARTGQNSRTWSDWYPLTIEAVSELPDGQEVFAALAPGGRARLAQYRVTFGSAEAVALDAMTVTALNSVSPSRKPAPTGPVSPPLAERAHPERRGHADGAAPGAQGQRRAHRGRWGDVEGAQNAGYEPVLANMPASSGEPKTIDGVTVDARQLLPPDRGYYRYDGSLTTPPCTEGVKWFVMAKPVELSASQIAAFRALYQNNYRPVQPLNGRAFLLTAQQPPAVLPGTGGSASLVAGTLAGVCLLIAFTRLGLRRRRPRIRRHPRVYSTLLSSK